MADEVNGDKQQKPTEVKFLSINLTPNVGANDAVLAVRIVPDGRDGQVVFARGLRPGEKDDDTPVLLSPGERLVVRPRSVQISIQDVDRQAERGPDGYVRIAGTIWTWLSFGNPTGPQLFNYLLAAARRLDGAHELLAQVSGIMTGLNGGFIGIREQIFRAISLAEILTIALGRSVDMLDGLPQRFSVRSQLPATIETKKTSIREIRNAFEHIEDRALGQVQRRPHPDALTVFQQTDFITKGRLTYGTHSLDLRSEIPQIVVDARNYIYDVAVEVAGPARDIAPPIEFTL